VRNGQKKEKQLEHQQKANNHFNKERHPRYEGVRFDFERGHKSGVHYDDKKGKKKKA